MANAPTGASKLEQLLRLARPTMNPPEETPVVAELAGSDPAEEPKVEDPKHKALNKFSKELAEYRSAVKPTAALIAFELPLLTGSPIGRKSLENMNAGEVDVFYSVAEKILRLNKIKVPAKPVAP